MNRNKLKQYAPLARRDFIAAVTDRAASYGLTKKYIQPITEHGDVALIGSKPFPRYVAEKRKRLEGHIKQRGFEQVMEAMAYTWFNRLLAIRFMELHGYLDDGYRVLSHAKAEGRNPGFRHDNYEFFFKPSLTWSDISSSYFGVRVSPAGYVFDNVGPSLFCDDEDTRHLLAGLLCSRVSTEMMIGLNPTMHFLTGNVSDIPVVDDLFAFSASIQGALEELVSIAKADWDSVETSSDMLSHPLLMDRESQLIEAAFARWQSNCNYAFATTKRLEEQVNEQVNQAYGLEHEIPSALSDEAITLHGACREDDMKSLISYAIGCMMGRYSLDKLGLIYANSGNQGFDPSQYKTFRADDDGIIPLFGADWGIQDDAANRIVEFISAAWPKEHLEENLTFIADCLGPNNGEQARETIRRYVATGFYKHHLSMYKKRPIYWLFSSGKHRAFQCLVYLHRYNESTLSRMRIEYVIPLQGKISSRISQLADDIAAANSTSHRKKLEKERDTLVKQQAELRTFDEKLRHYADKRISLDLDDGVKINYDKFGDLLADVKAVTGGTEEP
jgi:hypothetical protein